MAACGTKWDVHRIEDDAPREVLTRYFSDAQLGHSNKTHAHTYNHSAFLTPDVVHRIKQITRKERAYFGYDVATPG